MDAPQPVEHPLDEQTPVELNNDFHQDDPIVNPAYIEYHDGIIYRWEPNQTEEQIDSDLQQAAIGATCMVCNQCQGASQGLKEKIWTRMSGKRLSRTGCTLLGWYMCQS